MATHGIVGYKMVYIVAAFPPPNRQTTDKVANEDADQRINDVVVCDPAMPSVVCCEHDLLPKDAQCDRRRDVPSVMQERQEEAEEGQVTTYFCRVVAVAAIVVAFIVYPLMKCTELDGNVALSVGIEGWVFGDVGINGLLNCDCSV